MRIFDRNVAAALATLTLCAAQLSAEPEILEPIITKSKIEEIAIKCDAKITISDAPDYSEETGKVREKAILLIGIERSNSPNAITCVQAHIPTVVTTLVGREKGVPPLNQEILDAVLNKCKWRPKDGVVRFVNGGDLQFQPDPSADYDRVACVLAGIRPYYPRMGFIGNEAYAPEEEQK